MSDSDTVGPARTPATTQASARVPSTPRPEPVALLVLDTATGRLAACNPAARRRLAGTVGARLSHWLSHLATAAAHRDAAVVRTWSAADPAGASPDGPDGPVDGEAGAHLGGAAGAHLGGAAGAHLGGAAGAPPEGPAVRLRALSTPIAFRSRACLLVVLRDDATTPDPLTPGATGGIPTVDPAWAVFTLDVVGRVDSWGATPQRLTGFRPAHVLGGDTTLLHPAPARLAGDHHRALTQAYRAGDHRTEGWRLCADGRLIWAEVTTVPLYDAVDRLLGFAQVIHDVSPVHRLRRGTGRPVAPSAAAAELGTEPGHEVGPRDVPAPRGPLREAPRDTGGSRRPAGRIPTQRRP